MDDTHSCYKPALLGPGRLICGCFHFTFLAMLFRHHKDFVIPPHRWKVCLLHRLPLWNSAFQFSFALIYVPACFYNTLLLMLLGLTHRCTQDCALVLWIGELLKKTAESMQTAAHACKKQGFLSSGPLTMALLPREVCPAILSSFLRGWLPSNVSGIAMHRALVWACCCSLHFIRYFKLSLNYLKE